MRALLPLILTLTLITSPSLRKLRLRMVNLRAEVSTKVHPIPKGVLTTLGQTRLEVELSFAQCFMFLGSLDLQHDIEW